MASIINQLVMTATVACVAGCGDYSGEFSDLDVHDDVGVAEAALVAPASCGNGSISYGQSKTTAAPASTYCFTQPIYNDQSAKYYYKVQYGPTSGGNWVTTGQQLASWTGGRFAIRIWYNNQLIVEKIKNVGDFTSPIEATFYGLSGQNYYIQTGILYNNGNFCTMCAIPWFTMTRILSLGLH